MELLIKHLFFGICSNFGWNIYEGEATDAYAHQSALNNACFSIDYVYDNWYKDKYNKDIGKNLVLPGNHVLQGHPETSKLSMKMIDHIIDELGFQTTTPHR